ncbi:MAG: glutamate--tRNA ligase [Bacteroidia bacterium]|nr:glutamate--tRNA ligase [Bacteroidia bacterium]
MSAEARIRFAPSPTGPLHMGGVRTALYNYLFAKKMGGQFILRIEDTDQNRYVEGAEEYIINALDWCGIKFDEGPHIGGQYGPYRQSERKANYKQYADQLIASGHAYYAFDTPEDLEEMRERLKKAGVASPQYNAVSRMQMKNSVSLSEDEVQKRLDADEPYVVRIKMPRNEEIKINDLIRGWVVFNSNQLDDKVLLKADGMPTYHLANIADDHEMEITHVIRGEEWLPSAPLHVLLYKYLNWDAPDFAHLPLILKPDGNGKLSKRDGDRLGFPVFPLNWTDPVSGEESIGYRERGFYPEAFVNLLALLGWNPGTNEEIFNMDELVKAFSIERVGKSGSKFDYEKAKWFNQHYLRSKENVELLNSVKESIADKNVDCSDEYLLQIIEIIKEKLHFIDEFWSYADFFFERPTQYDDKVLSKKWNDKVPALIEAMKGAWIGWDSFEKDRVEEMFKQEAEKLELKASSVFQIFRIMLIGRSMGPPLFDLFAILDKKEVEERLDNALKHISTINTI